MTIRTLCCLLLAWGSLVAGSAGAEPVRVGADILVRDRLAVLQTKRVGIITNHTGRLSNGTPLVDTLVARGIRVTALFGPEHGIRGAAAAGEKLADARDPATGIPVYSLYGAVRKPTAAMLANVDLLLYDIQDVGVRFYTYISTMALAMEAAAERGIPFVVLDRPNPLGGTLTDGPVRVDSLTSFVGHLPVPVVYGLTCGELARMIAGEGWLAGGVRPDLTVIPMEGWERRMLWTDTGLPWPRPSPNLPTFHCALIYPATCFIEATALSEGRGTDAPFRMVGAPFVDGALLATRLQGHALPGVQWSPVRFTPRSSKHAKVSCGGIRGDVTDPAAFRPMLTALTLLSEIRKAYPAEIGVRPGAMNRLMGSTVPYAELAGGRSPGAIPPLWQEETARFEARAAHYRLYP